MENIKPQIKGKKIEKDMGGEIEVSKEI